MPLVIVDNIKQTTVRFDSLLPGDVFYYNLGISDNLKYICIKISNLLSPYNALILGWTGPKVYNIIHIQPGDIVTPLKAELVIK